MSLSCFVYWIGMNEINPIDITMIELTTLNVTTIFNVLLYLADIRLTKDKNLMLRKYICL